ncbi:uncharacterized protein HKW66_Vig0093960 [Vigna angularis]|uniref:Uncharacterized protein n=1 Tax=Phaseolus angularis TaxID=3914 RepID=A0A8T0KL11_PHAAN|nr:uncharacterized protein HKW66_Vig0093960 [Vigna angularis]
MITRSNLAEQLREYQIRSKHDWASVSFFSSTSSNIATSRGRGILGGCGGFCNMGTYYFSLLGIFGSLSVLQAHPTCFYFSLRHNPIAFMHENYKASKTRKEKETKDASSIVNVKRHQVLTFGIFLFSYSLTGKVLAILDHFHWCGRCEVLLAFEDNFCGFGLVWRM